MKHTWLLVVAACHSGGSKHRDAWPVGLLVGGICTYEAAPAVATINGKYATLIGEGTITETCGDQKMEYDVLKPTALEVRGPDSIKIGEQDSAKRSYNMVLFAGKRELTGLEPRNTIADWKLGDDCNGVATIDPPLGAQDTGGRDIDAKLVTTKAGACTLKATLYGLNGAKTIIVK